VSRTARATAAALASLAPPLWNNRIAPALGLGPRGRTLAHLGFAAAYALATRARPNWRSARGIGAGLAAGAVVVAGAGAAMAVRPVRTAVLSGPARLPEVAPAEWIGVHIPFGTVLPEELIFRGGLDPLLTVIAGPRTSLALGAAAFGLWHMHPARAAGDPVLPTVVATATAGALFTLLGRRAGSATAPALLHLAINATGAVVATLAGRPQSGSEAPE